MIVQKRRVIGGKQVTCPECNTLITINKPIMLDMPYCGGCGMIVLDAAQKYCCWCGIKMEEANHEDA